MAEKTVLISQQLLKPIKILKWRVTEGNSMSIGSVLLLYDFDGAVKNEQRKLKSTRAGTVHKLIAPEGAIIKPGEPLLRLRACIHPTVMKDMCAECGADLRIDDIITTASVPMVHSIPELKVSEELALKLGKADGERLLRDRKLVLLVDLDQTLIHTTNDNIPPNIKDVYHFQLYGQNSPWYHTRLRPGTHEFLSNISTLFELHICTFGARNYAHTITMFLDGDQTFFSNRILSRDECFDPTSKKANLKALFPCGDNMVCIIDDREDVWNHALNLIHVKPYHFFQHTGDINAPPGLDKHERDNKEGVDLTKLKKKPEKPNGKNVKEQPNGLEDIKTNGAKEENGNDDRCSKIVDKCNMDKDQTPKDDHMVADEETDVVMDDSEVEKKNDVIAIKMDISNITAEKHNSEKDNDEQMHECAENAMKGESMHDGVIDLSKSVDPKKDESRESEGNKNTAHCTDPQLAKPGLDNKLTEHNINNKDVIENIDDTLENNIDVRKLDQNKDNDRLEKNETDGNKHKLKKDGEGSRDEKFEQNKERDFGEDEKSKQHKDQDSFKEDAKSNIDRDFCNDDNKSEQNKNIYDTNSEQSKDKKKSNEAKANRVRDQCEEDGMHGPIKDEKADQSKRDGTHDPIEEDKKPDQYNEDGMRSSIKDEISDQSKRDGTHDPIKEDIKPDQCKEDEKHDPIKEDRTHDPIKQDGTHDPIKQDGTHDPIKQDGMHDPIKEDTKNDQPKEGKKPDQAKEDDLIEIEDPDDYLLHLEDILKRIHKTFYEQYDKLESGEVPDLKQVIPNVRNHVLKGIRMIFSGLVPTHIKLEQSKAYQVARSLGATVTQDLDEETTHLVAVRPGTAKVNAGRRRKNLKIVTPDWLWSCAERWEHVEEAIYPLSSKGSKNRHPPPHCSSPEHVPCYPVHDTPAMRKRTPSGRFMDTINPLMSFSSDDIADMDKEVEDILDDESDESGEEEPKEMCVNVVAVPKEETSSSSDESLTGEYPRGFKRTREKRKLESLNNDEEDQVESSLDEFPSTKFRRGEQLDSDLDIGQESNSEGSMEPPDEVDDGEWNMMGAALEREFLSNN